MTCASSASQARSCASASNSTVTLHARLSPTSARNASKARAIGRAREQLVAVDQIEQRHRLLAQRVDDVPIVDDVTALALGDRPPAPQRHHRRRAEEAVEPVVVEVHAQAMADQPRRRRVEHAAQNEAAARRDRDDLLLVVGGPPLG